MDDTLSAGGVSEAMVQGELDVTPAAPVREPADQPATMAEEMPVRIESQQPPMAESRAEVTAELVEPSAQPAPVSESRPRPAPVAPEKVELPPGLVMVETASTTPANLEQHYVPDPQPRRQRRPRPNETPEVTVEMVQIETQGGKDPSSGAALH